MKLAIVGKGGVGKTTLAAALARWRASQACQVVAVDADPDGNLAAALGVPAEQVPVPIAKLRDLIRQRTGAQSDGGGLMFKLNPRVDDLPELYSTMIDGVRLLVLGSVDTGGAGCLCPENTVLKNLLQHLLLRIPEDVILDMEAGLEHLGRASAAGVDAMIAVIEPGMRSVQTATRIERLARDIGVRRTVAVANKIREPGDLQPLRQALGDLTVVGWLPYDPELIEADLEGRPVLPTGADAPSGPFAAAVAQIGQAILSQCELSG